MLNAKIEDIDMQRVDVAVLFKRTTMIEGNEGIL
jgi:hypothetical protein